ncbi:MAG: UDP-glucose 4-epimerase GalE [Cytophagales bacterium]|nr:UDP-glucose 4-epimerase GalE [Cytophagales bacterium]
MAGHQVLVTGGAGYIGVHTLVELMNAGAEPIVVDDLSRGSMRLLDGAERIAGRRPIFHRVDCADRNQLKSVFDQHPGIQSVIHFAAFKSVIESVENPLLYYQNNMGSLLSLMEIMRQVGVNRLVFSSSCTVYGQPDQIPVGEDAPFKRPESPYGATKQMGEQILQDLVRGWKDLRVVSLRYFNPVGAHPSGLIGELPVGVPNNLVPYITQTAIGKRDALTIFGSDYDTPDGTCLRDFIHVVDLAVAHVKAMEAMDRLPQRFEAINLGSGVPCSVLELVKTFIKETGVNLNYVMGPRRPGDIEKVYADPGKSFRLLNWKTARSTEDGLRDAWNWEQKLEHAPH